MRKRTGGFRLEVSQTISDTAAQILNLCYHVPTFTHLLHVPLCLFSALKPLERASHEAPPLKELQAFSLRRSKGVWGTFSSLSVKHTDTHQKKFLVLTLLVDIPSWSLCRCTRQKFKAELG